MLAFQTFAALAFCLVLADAKPARDSQKVEVDSTILQSLISKAEQNKAELNNLRSQLHDQSVAGRRHDGEDEIAFNVLLSHDFGPASGNSNIPFDVVYHNKGGGWNSETHTFVVPKNGFYFFTASIAADVDQSARAAIVHMPSHTKMVSMWATAGGGDSNQVILVLNEGGTIAVQVSGDDNSVIHSSEGDYLTTFSGFLLWST